jgi:hypothetical protein
MLSVDQYSPEKQKKSVSERINAKLSRFPVIIRPVIIILVIINGLFLIFLWMLNEYYKFFKNGKASKNWPTTEGTIHTSRVDMYTGSEGGATYQPIIEYSYQVADKQYFSSRIYVGSTRYTGGPRNANKWVARFPAGNLATVYYDPVNPDQAVLEPGTNATLTILILIFGPIFSLFLLLGQMLFWFFLGMLAYSF